jgi:hypothetical protein
VTTAASTPVVVEPTGKPVATTAPKTNPPQPYVPPRRATNNPTPATKPLPQPTPAPTKDKIVNPY